MVIGVCWDVKYADGCTVVSFLVSVVVLCFTIRSQDAV